MSTSQQILTSAITAAIVAPAASLLGQRWSQTREDHARFLTLRREAYVGLLSAASEARRAGGLLQSAHASGTSLGDASLEDLHAELDAARLRASEHFDQIRLLAPKQVVRSAFGTASAITLLRTAVLGIEAIPFTDDEIRRLYERSRELERDARIDLRVDRRGSDGWMRQSRWRLLLRTVRRTRLAPSSRSNAGALAGDTSGQGTASPDA